jgi:hypothetical protein
MKQCTIDGQFRYMNTAVIIGESPEFNRSERFFVKADIPDPAFYIKLCGKDCNIFWFHFETFTEVLIETFSVKGS